MKVSVLINNYNYQDYVIDAVNSALEQSRVPDEIIVIDDGSSDESVVRLKQKFANHPIVKLVFKENAGQLSCFNQGFQRATGDLVFFLDSDDLYKPDYLKQAIDFYECHPECDFLICDFERIGQSSGCRADYRYDRDLGKSAIAALYRYRWVGAITTTLSVRREILEKVLPVPFLTDWINGAESCLIYGASIVGAHKFYCSQSLIQYRLHGTNDHFTRQGRVDKIRRERLFKLFTERTGDSDISQKQADIEFNTIEKPLYKEFRYCQEQSPFNHRETKSYVFYQSSFLS